MTRRAKSFGNRNDFFGLPGEQARHNVSRLFFVADILREKRNRAPRACVYGVNDDETDDRRLRFGRAWRASFRSPNERKFTVFFLYLPDGERRPARNVGLRSLFVSLFPSPPRLFMAGDAESDTV